MCELCLKRECLFKYCELCRPKVIKERQKRKYAVLNKRCEQNEYCNLCGIIFLHQEKVYCGDCKEQVEERKREDERETPLLELFELWQTQKKQVLKH